MKEYPPLPPDPVIEAYKKDIDVTLIRESLKRTADERLQALIEMQRFAEELRRAGDEAWRREKEARSRGR